MYAQNPVVDPALYIEMADLKRDSPADASATSISVPICFLPSRGISSSPSFPTTPTTASTRIGTPGLPVPVPAVPLPQGPLSPLW